MYQTILVPLDGSKRAEAIMRHVEELALRYDAKVILLRVEEEIFRLGHSEHFDVSNYQQERSEQRKEDEAYLAGLQGELREKGIEANQLILSGPVVQVILDTATREAADLIAMASHGRSGLARAFYGSAAVGVLHRVDRPLLIIRSRECE